MVVHFTENSALCPTCRAVFYKHQHRSKAPVSELATADDDDDNKTLRLRSGSVFLLNESYPYRERTLEGLVGERRTQKLQDASRCTRKIAWARPPRRDACRYSPLAYGDLYPSRCTPEVVLVQKEGELSVDTEAGLKLLGPAYFFKRESIFTPSGA